MTRTVRSCSHRLWIWHGQCEPPATTVRAEGGSERTEASGLSQTLHMRWSTYSNTAVMSALAYRARGTEKVNAQTKSEKTRCELMGENPQRSSPITPRLHSFNANPVRSVLVNFTVGKLSGWALDFTMKVISFIETTHCFYINTNKSAL